MTTPPSCERVAELLPWWANGTLSPNQAADVERHLAVCASCREERDQTLSMLELFDTHPSTEALLAVAWDEDPGLPRPWLDAHLEMCASCAEDLELTRQSRRLAEHATVPPLAPRRRAAWRLAAVAAAVVLAIGTVIWLVAGRPRDEVRTAATPQVNATVAQLFPRELVTRGDGAPVDEIRLPAEARWLTLILASQTEEDGPFRLKLTDERGVVVWASDELRRQPPGDFTLALPARLLDAGRYGIEVRPLASGATETFHFEVVGPRN